MSTPSEGETVLLANFIEMTGLDFETASHYLQAANYDISAAFHLLPENQSHGMDGPTVSSASASAALSSTISQPSMQCDDVRAADPVQQQQLLGGGVFRSNQRENAFARGEDPSVEWIFPPPNHISFPGSLHEARTQAKTDKKWLLFNIQHHTEFSSHMLNRDVWTNDTLVSLIRMNFLFWQRGSTSVDGRNFMSMYQISEFGDDLPLVGIVDPRTGGIVFTMKGSFNSADLTHRIIEFLDENSMDSNKAPITRNYNVKPPGSAALANDDGDSDDEQYVYDADEGDSEVGEDMAAAIALSVQAEEGSRNIGEVVEPEPGEGTAGVVKVSLRLLFPVSLAPEAKPTSSIVRRFRGEQTVSQLFAFVSSLLPSEHVDKKFDLLTGYPRATLSPAVSQTLQEAGLAGSQIFMKWD